MELAVFVRARRALHKIANVQHLQSRPIGRFGAQTLLNGRVLLSVAVQAHLEHGALRPEQQSGQQCRHGRRRRADAVRRYAVHCDIIDAFIRSISARPNLRTALPIRRTDPPAPFRPLRTAIAPWTRGCSSAPRTRKCCPRRSGQSAA